jgi:uncharacterized membrane protein YedE/YeeE
MASSVTTSATIASRTTASEARSAEMPMPALLVERAIALGRAEVGLALVHTRRIAVRAVSALLGTIVACAFAQLTLVLLIAWPVLVARIPLVNLLAGVLMSAVLAAAGGIFAALTWSAVARERRPSSASKEPKANGYEMKEASAKETSAPVNSAAVNLAERVS